MSTGLTAIGTSTSPPVSRSLGLTDRRVLGLWPQAPLRSSMAASSALWVALLSLLQLGHAAGNPPLLTCGRFGGGAPVAKDVIAVMSSPFRVALLVRARQLSSGTQASFIDLTCMLS